MFYKPIKTSILPILNVSKPSVLAIIPARGGSKGIPHKNIAKLNGKPLIAYTIECAKKSKFVHEIVVSTDDSKIADISKRYGVKTLRRPSSLAQDRSSSESVFYHVLSTIKEDFPDIVVILQPTSPLRTSSDIDAAVKLFLKSKCDSVVSVCPVEHPPHWIYKKTSTDRLTSLLGKTLKRRQDASNYYRLNGAVYVTSAKQFLKRKKILTTNIKGYVMPHERSVDIDSLLDLKFAEFLLTV